MTSPVYQIVITSDRFDNQYEEKTLAAIDDMRIELKTAAGKTGQDLADAARDADALLVSSRESVDRNLLTQLDRCKVVSRYAVGIDSIDLDAATELGIVVTHVPDYCTAEVADHALALILALNRRIVEIDRDLHQGAWIERSYHTREILRGPIPPLRSLTLGLVGLGRIGSAVARRAAPFGLHVVASDPYLPDDLIRESGAEPVTLEDLAAIADIISIHCPLTRETNNLIGSHLFELMKPSAVLVNTARGPIINMDDLIAALTERKIAGAALDVVDPESLPQDSFLYHFPNVILTPHSAYYSERSVELVREEALDGVLRVLRGELPRTVANPAVIERLSLAPYSGR